MSFVKEEISIADVVADDADVLGLPLNDMVVTIDRLYMAEEPFFPSSYQTAKHHPYASVCGLSVSLK